MYHRCRNLCKLEEWFQTGNIFNNSFDIYIWLCVISTTAFAEKSEVIRLSSHSEGIRLELTSHLSLLLLHILDRTQGLSPGLSFGKRMIR